MSILTKTRLDTIKDERIKTQDRIRKLKEELFKLDAQEITNDSEKNELEVFMDSIAQESVSLLSLLQYWL